MPQVMKTQVAYVKKIAHLPKGAVNRSWLKWKYPVVIVHLSTHYFPCFRRVVEPSDLVSLGLSWWLTPVFNFNINYCFITLDRFGVEGDSSGLNVRILLMLE